MPTVDFDIESHSVSAIHQGGSGGGGWRIIRVTSPAFAHGIRYRASVSYSDLWQGSLGSVTNVDQPNYDGLNVYAFLPRAEFAEWYDILRNEAPLQVSFYYPGSSFDPSTPTRPLSWIQLSTGQPEPPGEDSESLQLLRLPSDVQAGLGLQQAADDAN